MKKKNIEKMTLTEYKKYFWSDYNEKCKSCKNKCKQSWLVEVVKCPDYVKK